DYRVASRLARQMVGQLGMSALGPIWFPLDEEGMPLGQIDPATLTAFGKAWKQIVNDCYARSVELVKEYEERIKRVAEAVLKEETISGDRFRQLWNSNNQPETSAPVAEA